ncbi:unnamed protein product, partial [Brenthis ino]
MSILKQIIYLLCLVCFAVCAPRPDSGGHAPLPGPGLSYGGIPYGSMSGNVAEYFRNGPRPVYGGLRSGELDYAPIEQYL